MFVFFMDQWKILNVSDIPPALSLAAPGGAVVRNGPILFWSGPSSVQREQYRCWNFNLERI